MRIGLNIVESFKLSLFYFILIVKYKSYFLTVHLDIIV